MTSKTVLNGLKPEQLENGKRRLSLTEQAPGRLLLLATPFVCSLLLLCLSRFLSWTIPYLTLA